MSAVYGRTWVAAVIEALLPSSCLDCGAPLDLEYRGMCGDCWNRINPVCGCRCPRCGGPSDDAEEPCLRCSETLPPQDATVAWGEHAAGLRSVILALKHHGRDEVARPLAKRLAGRVAMEPWCGDLKLVTAVPSHPWHRLRRGYSAAELVAREVALGLGLPYSRVLRRRHLDRQATRSRAQRLHLAGDTFRARRILNGERVLLVDDVTTTGTTLRRATSALRRAGAAAVYCATLAYSPESRRM